MADGPVPKWMHSLISTNRMGMGNTLKWIRYYDIVTNISSFLSHTLNSRREEGSGEDVFSNWNVSRVNWITVVLATGPSTQGIVTQ